MLTAFIIGTVIALLFIYANRRLNPDATIQNIVHVVVIVVYVLFLLDLFTGRHYLGRLG